MKFVLSIDPDCIEAVVNVRAAAIDERVRAIEAIACGSHSSTITGYRDGQIKIVELRRASRFFTNNKKVYAAMDDGIWQIRHRMFELEEILPLRNFVRISQSDIVNIRAIDRVETSFTTSLVVVLKDGTRCPISRRYLSAFKRAIGI